MKKIDDWLKFCNDYAKICNNVCIKYKMIEEKILNYKIKYCYNKYKILFFF